MKISVEIQESGKFTIEKSEGIPVFTAIGMLELAKKIMLDNDGKKENKEVEEEDDVSETM